MARQWQLPGSDHRGSLHCVILYVFLLVTLIFCTNIPPSTAMSNILNPCTSLKCLKPRQPEVESSWNVMAHGDARVEKWRANKRMEWVTSKRHMTAEHRLARVIQTLQADVYSWPASSRLNWRPSRFKWTRPFRWKVKSGFCACAITFQTESTRFLSQDYSGRGVALTTHSHLK